VETAILVAAGYVVGSMPWGYWLVRVFRGEDIRTKGSGNIGATNVWRVYGKTLGIPAAVLDTAKGFVPAFVATQLVGPGAGVLAGVAAMLGHWRPLFLGFRRGGKMVATAGGACLGIAPLVAGVAAGVWLLAFALTRYASVASMAAAGSLALWAWLLGYRWPVIAFGGFAGAAVLVLHRANIHRLLHGEENRFRSFRSFHHFQSLHSQYKGATVFVPKQPALVVVYQMQPLRRKICLHPQALKQHRLSPIANLSMTVLSLKVNMPGWRRPKKFMRPKKILRKKVAAD